MNKKTYEVLKDFKGSPDGYTVIEFKAGQDDVELSEELAKVALEEKWVRPSKAGKKEAKAEAERIAAAEAAQREADIVALKDRIAQLKVDLEEAETEEAKAGIFAEAEAKQAELDALLA